MSGLLKCTHTHMRTHTQAARSGTIEVTVCLNLKLLKASRLADLCRRQRPTHEAIEGCPQVLDGPVVHQVHEGIACPLATSGFSF